METQVRTPMAVFMQPQRLMVPLFQRPYVWNEENQWEPLWNDVVRVSERFLKQPGVRQNPHFLGAVVLQQVQIPVGRMQQRTIIDGQQRLTTLQLLLDALHAELQYANAIGPAARIEQLVTNPAAFCVQSEDRFKVWPTNRDRPAFNAVMGAKPPVDYEAIGHSDQRMVQAHRYFSERIREWLRTDGESSIEQRGTALETVAREHLQMVVIDLAADENAQEIFETLNARGAQLTAADLIKNFVFQRLQESSADVENAYERLWKEFETAFWETEISAGRQRSPRSSIFLNHWLVACTGEEIVARDVFIRFKNYTNRDGAQPMLKLLEEIDRAAKVYRSFIEGGTLGSGTLDRLALFAYRTGVLESEVIKPLILFLLDPELPSIPAGQFAKVLDTLESWMVRRMLVRATTKAYNQLIAELITQLRKGDRSQAGDLVSAFLARQDGSSSYWPDDLEIREELLALPAYRRLGRGRLRMVLEALEDHRRGWRDGQASLGADRVARGKYAIEHIMPRKWNLHWPLPDGSRGDGERDALIHTIGNLTLLTGRLNAKVSNGPWTGPDGKRGGLETHDVLQLNRELLKKAGETWNDASIRSRSDELAKFIIEIWPVPPGHRSGFSTGKVRPRHQVDLADLVVAGCLTAGTTLVPRRKKFADQTATVLSDGRLDVKGVLYSSPSQAAKTMTGGPMNGWWFFLVDTQTRRSIADVRRDYRESIATELDDEDDDEGDDEG